MMLELALDIGEQARGADTEQIRLEPVAAQFLLHQELIVEHVLCRRDSAGRLEADLVAGALLIHPDHPQHRERHRQRRIHALLAGGRLDEVGAGHHADHRCLGDVAECLEIARSQNRLQMRVAAGRTKIRDLRVKRAPIAGQHMLAGDDNVDLLRTIPDGRLDLLQLQVVRHEARRKSGRDRGNRDAGSIECLDRRRNETVIDTDRAGVQLTLGKAERLENVAAHGGLGLGAKSLHPFGGVVAVEGRQVDAGDRFQKPRRLRVLLDRSPARQARNAPLGRRQIDPDLIDPIHF